MKRSILLFLFISTCSLQAQTLFTYGDHKVSKQEFLRAYNKNNTDQQSTEKAYRDYLELYLRFKLKVQEALDKKMDTLPGQQADLQSFRNQAAEGFMTDDSTVEALVNEAFERSKRDIHIAHIFIPFNPTPPGDTITAFQKATDAYNELKRGTDFGNVARIYSADSAVQWSQGDIGFITVFTLPYALETLAYSTTPGSFSAPYHSNAGYHIFKNIGERPAAGRMKTAQILLLFAPGATDSLKYALKLKADSLYKALQQGASFEALAKQYSNDNLTYELGGEMPEFTVGKYDPVFEKAAFGLLKDGDISRPVLTQLGYHIVKRLALLPVNKDSANAVTFLRQQVLNDSRRNIAEKAMVQKAYRITGLSPEMYNEYELLNLYRDSLEKYNPEFAAQMQEFKEGNLLFEIMQLNVWDKPMAEQASLEEKWVAALKEKYLVKIDEEVFTSLLSARGIPRANEKL
ncbi:MAG TPA: peptidylprolyl isomerase [Chitinophagaceae bacterium]|nr:peptidylprolyl isomerase [Chitinophagaceae bacterium]